MNDMAGLFGWHGAAILFAAIFIEQAGIPVPAIPWLLAAGALAGTGKINAPLALGAAILGCLLADAIWFYLGRFAGRRVLGLLCHISLDPDSCVTRTQNVFDRYGMSGVVVSKFIPGVSTLIPPLAGNSTVSATRFLVFDGLGSLLYCGSFIVLGLLFSRQLEPVLRALAGLGSGALVVLGVLLALFIAYKYLQRWRLLSELRMARISVDELYRMVAAGENPVIVDLRSAGELEHDRSLIRGAMHMTLDQLPLRHQEIPRDRDIILYCSCPNEATSAKAALLLRAKGIQRVRPLLGGIDAWRERKYPMEMLAVEVPAAAGSDGGSPAAAGVELPGPKVQIVVTPESQPSKAPQPRSA